MIVHDEPKFVPSKIETTFERVLYADEKSCAIVIKGDNGDRIEWTTGEASPKNNKNAYPRRCPACISQNLSSLSPII